jgi:hypothetical protein
MAYKFPTAGDRFELNAKIDFEDEEMPRTKSEPLTHQKRMNTIRG